VSPVSRLTCEKDLTADHVDASWERPPLLTWISATGCPFEGQLLDPTYNTESELQMTFKDLDKKALGSTAPAEAKTAPATKNDGKTPKEQTAPPDEKRAVGPKYEDDMFNNMPV
jgi:hypothetical protein